MAGFVHLHGHSTYSLLDGACRVGNLAKATARHGMPAMALTDHGNLFGAVDFYKACRKEGVKPILGYEAYVAPRSRFDRERNPVAAWHLTLLARNQKGWQNLIKLTSAGYMEGFYYVPRIDRELLARHSEGLVVMSGCLSSETSYWLRRGEVDKAREAAAWYTDVFGEHYYFEVQRHGIEDQQTCLEGCVELAQHFNRPLVATNDFHYEEREDAEAQELLVCINTGKTLQDEKRMKMSSQELYFKPPEEMVHLFRDLPGATNSTMEIAEKCDVEIKFGEMHLPNFDVPDDRSMNQYFRDVCEDGLVRRYGDRPRTEVRDRFEREFKVIEEMGFIAYFLIVWDFIRHAREEGIPVGPGRGSAAGSILSYCMEITDLDPLKYDLLFERFLNAERISMPDIDIDFCRDQREKVIKYVQNKYGGEERVAQIITFGTMAAKAAIRDVGRALGVPLSEVDKIAKKIPGGPGVTLTGALEADPELAAMAEDPTTEAGRLFRFARRLEGSHRNAGTHAAGVVIADAPLTEYVPLYKSGDDVSTQFPMDTIEQLGLLKMDFLGLKTLTLIATAVRLIEENGGEVPDFRIEPFTHFDDEKAYDLLSRGDSFGVFQLESSGMRDLLKKLKPRSFEETLVLIALFRPGPLDSGMTDVYCDRKNGLVPVVFDHESLEPILKNTYGVIVYQEQVMLIAHQVAGFSLNQADSLRKAMGKKKPEVMEPFKEPFLVGCEATGMTREVATGVWDQMATFARYGFNKSHAAAYAVVTYQTAWLKANYPMEFMAALLTVDSGNMDKVAEGLKECESSGIDVRAPDVNSSGVDFTVEGDVIRFGLTSVRGVGRQAAQSIRDARLKGKTFATVFDLAERVDVRNVNKSTLESLVKAGACDELGGHRAQLAEALDAALRAGASEQADRRAGQMSLLGAVAETTSMQPTLPSVPKWSSEEKLRLEREMTGRWWSSHPLDEHREIAKHFSSHDTRTIREVSAETPFIMCGVLLDLQERVIRSGRNEGKRMARFQLADQFGQCEAVMFSDAYARYRELLRPNAILFVSGDVDLSRDEINLRVDGVIGLEEAPYTLAAAVQIRLEANVAVDTLKALLERHSGGRPVRLVIKPEANTELLIRVDDALGIDSTPEFMQGLHELVGASNVRVLPRAPKRRERKSRYPRRGGS